MFDPCAESRFNDHKLKEKGEMVELSVSTTHSTVRKLGVETSIPTPKAHSSRRADMFSTELWALERGETESRMKAAK